MSLVQYSPVINKKYCYAWYFSIKGNLLSLTNPYKHVLLRRENQIKYKIVGCIGMYTGSNRKHTDFFTPAIFARL